MKPRCQLCGEFYEQGKLFVAAQGEACNDCISNLIDEEVESRMERDARRSVGGQSGSEKLLNIMHEAQPLKR